MRREGKRSEECSATWPGLGRRPKEEREEVEEEECTQGPTRNMTRSVRRVRMRGRSRLCDVTLDDEGKDECAMR